MKATLELTNEDIDNIVYEYFEARGYDVGVKRVSKEVKYEIEIDNWSMEKFD